VKSYETNTIIDHVVTYENNDADNDGYSNVEEIAALRYPGNPEDDPTKVIAPYRVVSLNRWKAWRSRHSLCL